MKKVAERSSPTITFQPTPRVSEMLQIFEKMAETKGEGRGFRTRLINDILSEELPKILKDIRRETLKAKREMDEMDEMRALVEEAPHAFSKEIKDFVISNSRKEPEEKPASVSSVVGRAALKGLSRSPATGETTAPTSKPSQNAQRKKGGQQ